MAQHLTHRELAKRSGLTVGAISNLERGLSRRPRIDTVEMLVKGLRLNDAEREEFVAAARGWTTTTLVLGPHNLPQDLPGFIGRESDVARARQLILANRLVTLTGTGGSGKTRLALAAAEGLLTDFPDGVFFVELAPLGDPALVADTIARTLGVHPTGQRPPLEGVRDHLRRKRFLLLLDNFEHLRPAAPVLDALLEDCPSLHIVTTSRVRLRRAEEVGLLVPPLDLPDPKQRPDPHVLAGYAAITLFAARAQSARQGVPLPLDVLPLVLQICRALDGLPLAIELAAARCAVLSPAEIHTRLDSRLALLTRGHQRGPMRHRTLHRALEWSHDLLEAGPQKLFRRLAVFAGGCTLEAAEATCNVNGDLETPTLDALQELVQHNLVRATATSDDIIRYTMLETIREYALQSLREAGEDVILRQRHGIYFLDLAEHADAAVENPLKVRWLYILEREHDNIREAERHFTNIKSAALCQRLGSALIWFWNLHNHLIEGRHFLDRALSLPGPAPIHCTAKILQERGHYAMYEGQFDVALEYLQRCDELLKHADVWPERALSLRSLGVLAHRRGDFATAETIYSEALALCVMRGAEQEKGRFFGQLGILALDQGNIVLAQRKLRESLLILREGGDQHLIAMCLENFGNAMMYGGDYLAADAAFQEGLRLHRENDYPWGAAECLDSLGRLAWYRGNYPEAHRYLTESLLLRREPPTYIWEVVESVESFAALAASELQPRRAARLWGAAETLNKAVHKPYSLAGHADFARARSSARALLDEETWHAEWEVGRNLSLQTVIALALDTQHQNTVGSDPTHDAAEMTHHALTAE